MKNIIKKALIISSTMFTFNVAAEMINVTSSDFKHCNYQNSCEIEKYGITLACTSGYIMTSGQNLYCYEDKSIFTIDSKIYPVGAFSINYRNLSGSNGEYKVISEYSSSFNKVIRIEKYLKKVKIENDRSLGSVLISAIGLKNTIHGDLKATASSLNDALANSYDYVSHELDLFNNNIAKSHMGHTLRFQKALNEGKKVLSEKSKDGKNLYSILDWRVQENARLIVAFGGILDELLTEYDHVDTLKSAIANMRVLVSELRDSYGWNRSIGGNVSKASATLLDVVRLELQELGMIKMSVGATVAHYQKLLKISGDLLAKVNAAKSGDMRAQREIYGFLDAWNSKEWQNELDILVHAEADVKNLVTPKLVMLLQAMESIEDLTEAGFEVPKLD